MWCSSTEPIILSLSWGWTQPINIYLELNRCTCFFGCKEVAYQNRNLEIYTFLKEIQLAAV